MTVKQYDNKTDQPVNVKEDIYPYIPLAEIVPELNPKDKGDYYETLCPECKHTTKKAYWYKNTGLFICNRSGSCKANISLWDYIQARDHLDQQGTLKALAEAAGVQLTDRGEFNPEDINRLQRKASILETANLCFQESIKQAKDEKDYLAGRGITETEISKWGLGYMGPDFQNQLKVKGYEEAEIREAGFYTGGFGDTHKITIPFKNENGTLKGFIVRSTLPKEKLDRGKYLNNYGLKLNSLFLLDQARGRPHIMIMEGFIDALRAKEQGSLLPAVATGGRSITASQAETLKGARVKQVTICMDGDQAGQDGTETSIKRLQEQGIKAYVMTLPGSQDPDEYIRDKGIEAFNQLASMTASQYKAERILNQEDLTTPPGQDRAKAKLIQLAETIQDPLEARRVIETLAERLNLPAETLQEEVKTYHEKKAEQDKRLIYDQLLKEGQRKLQAGEISDFQGYIEDKLQEARAKDRPKQTSLTDVLKAKLEQDKKRIPGERLGFKFTPKYKQLEENLDGLQPGLYILAADSNVGKTGLLTNMTLDLIEANPNITGIFVTIDDTPKDIIYRMLSIQTNLTVNQVKWPGKHKDIEEKGYKALIELAESGRLEIRDSDNIRNLDLLEALISETAEKKGPNFFVMIDAFLKLPTGKEISDIRLENKYRAERLKNMANKYGIPLIATTEFRKAAEDTRAKREPTLHTIAETRAFAYESNLCWLLYEEEGSDFTEEDIKIILKYAKNKLSVYKGKQTLTFKRSICVMEETEENGGF